MKLPKQKQSGYGYINFDDDFIAVLNHFGLFQPESKYKVLCPFHGDVNPSMLIDLENGNFKCFGCELHGGALDMMKAKYANKTDFEIITMIKRLKLKKDITQLKQTITIGEKKRKNINAARDYYYNLPAINWFKCVDADDVDVKYYLRNRGFKMGLLNQVGIKLNTSESYKIIAPIRENGVFRGYVCRTTVKEVEEKRKYLYNGGFCRRYTLAGDFEDETVLLVEGYFDMLKAKQHGIKNVCAILGWKISESQIKKLLKKGVKNIVCGYDRDKAGRKGYVYLRNLKKFNVVRLHYPPNIKDFGAVNDEVFNESILPQIKQYNLK